MNWQPISEQVWDGIRAEFTLPAVGQVHQRLSELMEDPEPVMQQLVRVFIDEGTFCPGFQFLAGGQVHPTVRELFKQAMTLKIPHNCFTAWMVTPSRTISGSRPVDVLNGPPASLFLALESFSTENTKWLRVASGVPVQPWKWDTKNPLPGRQQQDGRPAEVHPVSDF